MASCDGTRCGAGGEESVNAGGAHCVVAFWVYEEGEAGVEVAVRFADGADVSCRIGAVASGGLAARHNGHKNGKVKNEAGKSALVDMFVGEGLKISSVPSVVVEMRG